jgi:hypothetical protein
MLLSVNSEEKGVTREELKKRIEVQQARNRAVLEKADAYFRWFDREVPIHEARTEQAFRELRESVRRR